MKIFLLIFLLAFGFPYKAQTLLKENNKDKSCKPILTLQNYIGDDTISKQDLSKLNNIILYYPCDKVFKFGIAAYEFTAVINKKGVSLVGYNFKLTAKMKNVLQKMNVGDKIYIDNVSAKDSKGNVFNASGLTVHIGLISSKLKIDTTTFVQPK
ncbi:MAG TPA: hypothetical protein VNZ49_16190 [Bacteroidia bacterium]|jgi:hypothetical protein|nr:hypothetical protein [Bacteroidia bacterium]